MSQPDKDYTKVWDQRYQSAEYAYGKAPNEFFRAQLKKYKPGSILMPADGEGRNGVFAAEQGWTVTSMDLSSEGKTKALQLASERSVKIDYLVGDLQQLKFADNSFDAIGLIYAHFTADKKISLHHQLSSYLKPGGVIIFEAFSKSHLPLYQANPKVGGSMALDMLFSKEEIMASFVNYDVLTLEETEIELNEGAYHIGKGSVIQFVGKKRY